MAKIKAGILGATGYTGVELVRILNQHPQVSLDLVTSTSFAGQDLGAVYPSLHLKKPLVLEEFHPHKVAAGKLDALFVAYPAGEAIKFVPALLQGGKKVIDLGADYRFKNAKTYAKWYKIDHSQPGLLQEAAYGLPEIFASRIKKARLVANPGCYVLTSLLALAPVLKNGLVDPGDIIVDGKSGVSGAGKSPTPNTHYPECNEGISPYKVFEHRHQAEMQEVASLLAGESAQVCFTPQLTPMTRGILDSVYVRLKRKGDLKKLHRLYQDFYKGEEFVRILPLGTLPSTKQVLGSNYCDIALRLAADGKRLVILSVTDNLIKGAAGNAIQNLNLMFDLPPETGLLLPALYP